MHKNAMVRTFACTIFSLTSMVEGAVSTASGSTSAAGPHIPTAGRKVNLMAYSDNDGPKSVVDFMGAIGDYGEAIRTSAGGSAVNDYNELQLTVTRGSFRLDIEGVKSRLVRSI